MADMGTAWLNVVPSFKNVKQAVQSNFSGVGAKIGADLSKSIGASFAKLGKVGFGATIAGVAGVGAAVASLVPEVLSASDATDKFKQTLDFAGVDSGQIDKLTASAREYANRTVYDLADIQNVTAQLAANSVPNFDKLAEAAGNLNAVAGGNKETFKSVGMVLTQTAGAGKLTTENWNQLANAIPGASGKLQEALAANGAYTGNFRDAMAKGEITAEEFNQALLELGMNDAAVKAAANASTFEGAWGNLQASLVDGMAGILDEFKPALTGIVNQVANQLGPAFETATAKLKPVAAFVQGIAGDLEKGTLTLEDVAGKVATIAGGFGALWAGGTALTHVDTMMGAVDKLGALPTALDGVKGKAGAALDGLATDIRTRGLYVKDSLDTFGESFAGVGEKISGKLAPVRGKVQGAFEGVSGTVSQAASALGGRVSALGDVVGGRFTALTGTISAKTAPLQGAISGAFSKLSGPLSSAASTVQAGLAPLGHAFEGVTGLVTGPLEKMGGFVKSFFNPTRFLKILGIGAIVGGLIAGIGAVVSSGGSEMLAQIQNLATTLPTQLVGAINGIAANIPAFMETGVQVLMSLIEGITSALPQILSGAAQVISSLVTGLAQAVPQLIPAAVNMILTLALGLIQALPQIIAAGLQLILGLIQGIVGAIPTLISMIPQIIDALINGIITLIPMILTTGVQMLLALINGLVEAIPQLVAMIPQIIASLVDAIVNNLPMIISVGIQLLVSLVLGIAQALPQLITMGPQLILSLVTALAGAFPKLVRAGLDAIGQLLQGIIQAIPDVLSEMKNLPGKLVGSLGNLGKLLVDSGKSIINGLIDGIKSMANGVKDAVGGVLQAARNLLPFSPAKEGPFSGKGWTLYSGRSIVEALAQGVNDRSSLFTDALATTVAAGRDELDQLTGQGFGLDGVIDTRATLSGMLGVESADSGVLDEVRRLRTSLPQVIADFTPVMSARDLARIH